MQNQVRASASRAALTLRGRPSVNEMRRILSYMAVFLAAVVAACVVLLEPLRQAFVANHVFNTLILAVLVAGMVLNVRQVLHLAPALTWLQSFRDPKARLSVESRPGLLAPMQRLLTSIHDEGFRLPALTMRTMLESIRLRLEESRELSRYMTGLLIFLGLLGTFWGLLDTIDSVGSVIAGLSAGDDLVATFAELKTELRGPLKGMGTAFSSSLFGLGGALIVGFFDLQAGHAQNRFYKHLEEWLAELVHLPTSGGGPMEMEHSPAPGYVDALLEQTGEKLSDVSRLLARDEEERREMRERLYELSGHIAELTAQLRGEQRLLEELARSQLDLRPVIERLSDAGRADETMIEHLRGVDTTLRQMRDEAASGQRELCESLRSELRLVARALARKDGPPSAGD